MRDPDNAQQACAALSGAIAESAEEIHALSAALPGKGGYAGRAPRLAAHAPDVAALTAALAVVARPAQHRRKQR